MPYNIAKKLGGDTPSVDARMERCVNKLVADGKPKITAIAICKASVQKKLAKKK